MTDTSTAKRTLARDLVLYTAFRLGLVVVVFGVLYGIGMLFLDEVPPGLAYLGGALALVGVAVARRTARTRPTPPT